MGETQTAASAGKTDKSAAPIQKGYGVTLRDGAGSIMRIAVQRRKDGSATSFVINRVAKGKDKEGKPQFETNRGATATHPGGLDEARPRFDKLVAKAKQDGWLGGRTSGGGFRSKPDAFTEESLPKPVATKAAAKK